METLQQLLVRLARVLGACREVGAIRLTQQGLKPPWPSASTSVPSRPKVTVPEAVRGSASARRALTDLQAWSQGGWGPALPFAAAGVLAAALSAVQASCEAREAGSFDGSDVEQVRAAAMQIWEALDTELHRVEASLPSSTPIGRLPQPSVTKEGDDIVVEFFVPQALDVAGAVHELRRQLRSPAFGSIRQGMAGSSVTEESSAGQGSRAWTLRRRSAALGDMTVEVEQPRSPKSNAWFCFRGKQLREQDLRLIAATLHSAMQTKRKGPAEAFERDFGNFFDMGPLGRMFESMEPFLGHIQDMMKDFERMQQGLSVEADEGEGESWEEGDERDSLPTPLRRPKRWDDVPGSLGSGRQPMIGGGGGGPGAAEDAAAREQRRQQARIEGIVKKLQGQGAQVFLPGKKEDIDWGILAGYEAEKHQIEDTVLLALTHPDVYDSIARKTRRHYASNRPRAVLFEGPPGTGKTTSARVIATQAAVPLVYIPLEAIVSKWYGESERQLADMLKACESFPDGCIIFLDELDALATSRGTDMHEATRRLLGVLLRHLDGFDANKRTVVIGATNRRQDLDPALISRFSATVTFDLPTEDCRAKILRQYAQHLSDTELLALAHATPGMAGRDLRDVCEQAERHWASKIIRGKASKGQLPPLQEYLDAAAQRLREMAGVGADGRPLSFVSLP